MKNNFDDSNKSDNKNKSNLISTLIAVIIIIICCCSSSIISYYYYKLNSIRQYNKNIDDYNLNYNMNYDSENKVLIRYDDLITMQESVAIVKSGGFMKNIVVNDVIIPIYNYIISYDIVNYYFNNKENKPNTNDIGTINIDFISKPIKNSIDFSNDNIQIPYYVRNELEIVGRYKYLNINKINLYSENMIKIISSNGNPTSPIDNRKINVNTNIFTKTQLNINNAITVYYRINGRIVRPYIEEKYVIYLDKKTESVF